MVSPGHSSPKRRPLHERSQSQNNESPTSTARTPEGSRPTTSGPFPTLPAHIFFPNQGLNPPASENDYAVSDVFHETDSPAKAGSQPPSKNGRTLRRTKSKSPVRRIHGATTTSRPSSAAGPASSQTSNTRAPPSTATDETRSEHEDFVPGLTRLEHTSFRVPPLKIKQPAVSPPSTGVPGAEPSTALNHKQSTVSSLGMVSSENGSTTSFVRRSQATQPELARWLAYAENPSFEKLPALAPSSERPGSPRSRSASKDQRARRTSYSAVVPSTQRPLSRRSSSVSAISLTPAAKPATGSTHAVRPSTRHSEAHRAVSVPVNASASGAATANGSKFQYPTVRPPAAAGSWADTSITIPKRVRMNENALPRSKHYSADLSTVLSESEPGSQSLRDSRSARSSHPGGSLSEIGSLVVEPATSRASVARTGSSRRTSTIRLVSEADQRDGAVPEPSRWPTPRRSSRALEGPSNVRRSIPADSQGRSGSRDSDTLRSIPAWARYFHRKSSVEQMAITQSRPDTRRTNKDERAFYARGGPDSTISVVPPSSASSSRDSPPTTSPTSERFPQEIHRPRTRPRQADSGNLEGSSDQDEVGTPPGEQQTNVMIRGSPRTRVSRAWSPRLRHDKRASRLSIWEAPQVFEKELDQNHFNRRTLQITLFCVGFIFPFAWMCAALLPLPAPRRVFHKEKSPQSDIESALRSGQAVDLQYENARWWRNLNRIMSVLGLLVIGAIIALVVVAIKMRNATA